MNKIIALCFIGYAVLVGSYGYNGSTTAVVTLTGGIIKTQHIEVNKKYKRKECPVCKGTGKYLSGDGIKMVDCGYCESDPKGQSESEITHPPAVLKPDCKTRVMRK